MITDLVMKGQIARSQCAPLKGARAAATKKKKGPKAVLGKLWGSGKGKFRTNGKYSAATVRGTIWLVEDRCEGTLTKVTRGTVSVRDFKRKKTVTVKAGHSYLARAQRAASKSRALTSDPCLRRSLPERVASSPWGRHGRTRDAGPAVGRLWLGPASRSARSRRARACRDAAIDGSPLNDHANDTGLFQVTFDGTASGEFLARPSGLAYGAALRADRQTRRHANFTVYGATAATQFRPRHRPGRAGLTGSGVNPSGSS